MNTDALKSTAASLVAKGKGILAIDETVGTITKRFNALGIESTEDSRRDYRSLLGGAPGAGEHVSGAILFDETIRQATLDGTPIPAAFKQNGIQTGIKVDKRTYDLAGCPNEVITEGLDGLRDRLAEYRELGASFCKWRGVFKITADIPTTTAIHSNAHALARYAALCQEQGLVPIVEPEVLMDGDHDLQRCGEVTAAVQKEVFSELAAHGVCWGGMLLKPNMIIPGKDCPTQASVEDVADATLSCLNETVPHDVAGIVFLSGGQSAQLATRHLNAMNQKGEQPWPLSFSYGRALQNEAMAAWAGDVGKTAEAQKLFLHRAKCCSAACLGEYTDELEAAG